MAFPPKLGSPQWRALYEQNRVAIQFLRAKLSDDRQYLSDPMQRANDAAALQYSENRLRVFELDEELLTNPTPERIVEINAQRLAIAATEPEEFAFLKRLGQQTNERFKQRQRITSDVSKIKPVPQSPEALTSHDTGKDGLVVDALPFNWSSKPRWMRLMGEILLKHAGISNDQAIDIFKSLHRDEDWPTNKRTQRNKMNEVRRLVGRPGRIIKKSA